MKLPKDRQRDIIQSASMLVFLAVIWWIGSLVGCDDSPKSYPPPTFYGTGSIYVFNGGSNFHAHLNQWLGENKGAKLVSIDGINQDQQGVPQKYIVVVDFIGSPPPPQPVLDPSKINVESK
jgi:hypothetical protein